MANLKSCHECKCIADRLEVLNKVVRVDDEVEIVTFERKCLQSNCTRAYNDYLLRTDVCSSCQHVISTHSYKFWIEGDYQEYEMECALCGTAEDSISILPDDPRKILDIF